MRPCWNLAAAAGLCLNLGPCMSASTMNPSPSRAELALAGIAYEDMEPLPDKDRVDGRCPPASPALKRPLGCDHPGARDAVRRP